MDYGIIIVSPLVSIGGVLIFWQIFKPMPPFNPSKEDLEAYRRKRQSGLRVVIVIVALILLGAVVNATGMSQRQARFAPYLHQESTTAERKVRIGTLYEIIDVDRSTADVRVSQTERSMDRYIRVDKSLPGMMRNLQRIQRELTESGDSVVVRLIFEQDPMIVQEQFNLIQISLAMK